MLWLCTAVEKSCFVFWLCRSLFFIFVFQIVQVHGAAAGLVFSLSALVSFRSLFLLLLSYRSILYFISLIFLKLVEPRLSGRYWCFFDFLTKCKWGWIDEGKKKLLTFFFKWMIWESPSSWGCLWFWFSSPSIGDLQPYLRDQPGGSRNSWWFLNGSSFSLSCFPLQGSAARNGTDEWTSECVNEWWQFFFLLISSQ